MKNKNEVVGYWAAMPMIRREKFWFNFIMWASLLIAPTLIVIFCLTA